MQNVRKLTKPEIGGESRAIFLDYKVHAMYKIKTKLENICNY